jgi:hypothetical protein
MTAAPKELTCKCCEKQRFAENKPPRLREPVFVDGLDTPVLFCAYCDGDALRNAAALEEKRKTDK